MRLRHIPTPFALPFCDVCGHACDFVEVDHEPAGRAICATVRCHGGAVRMRSYPEPFQTVEVLVIAHAIETWRPYLDDLRQLEALEEELRYAIGAEAL